MTRLIIQSLYIEDVEMRYKFDYSDFSSFKEKDLEAFDNYEDFYRYCSSHTYLSGFAENSTHLFLKTSSEDGKDFVSFYDKRSKKMVSCSLFIMIRTLP